MRETYDQLAKLLEYPAADGRQDPRPVSPEVEALLETFHREVEHLTLEQMQELYVQTFDMNPAGSLEIGWHLFGENYERGEFLVKMRQEMRSRGVTESTELPDHLAHVLPVFVRMAPEEADEFAGAFLLPALEKMLAGLEGRNNPYEKVLAAVRTLLKANHTGATLEVLS